MTDAAPDAHSGPSRPGAPTPSGGPLAGAPSRKTPDTSLAAHSYAENIKHSRNNFLVLLIAQLYCLITIETTQDAALLSNSETQQLPILETSISIETFYILAPLLLLIVFFHFQIHLKSFWHASAGVCRAEGRPLVDVVDTYPWFITSSMARRFTPDNREPTTFASVFEYGAGLLFGWFSTAIVLFMMWARFLTKHDPFITTYHSFLVATSIAGGVYFLYSSKYEIQGRALSGWRLFVRSVLVTVCFVAPLALLMSAAWWLFEAQDSAGCQGPFGPRCEQLFEIRGHLGAVGLDPAAELDGVDVSTRLEAWTPAPDPAEADLATVRGADLRGVDLRYASARDALMVRADLREARLRYGIFDGAWLQGADLSGAEMSHGTYVRAHFERANLSDVRLHGADMTGAAFDNAVMIGASAADALFSEARFVNADAQNCRFERPDFRQSRFNGADFARCVVGEASFDGADMTEAVFAGAQLTGASVNDVLGPRAVFDGARVEGLSGRGVDFTAADFHAAEIVGSTIERARLADALFSEAVIRDSSLRDSRLRRADFRGARLSGVDLSGADLREAGLYGARFEAVDLALARLDGADLSGADLTGAANLTQSQLDRACGDATARLPAGLTIAPCAGGPQPL